MKIILKTDVTLENMEFSSGQMLVLDESQGAELVNAGTAQSLPSDDLGVFVVVMRHPIDPE